MWWQNIGNAALKRKHKYKESLLKWKEWLESKIEYEGFKIEEYNVWINSLWLEKKKIQHGILI